jgi:hypothetical protein
MPGATKDAPLFGSKRKEVAGSDNIRTAGFGIDERLDCYSAIEG